MKAENGDREIKKNLIETEGLLVQRLPFVFHRQVLANQATKA